MDLGIAGKRALVFGANRGIGFGIARALAAEGCHVALVARDEAKLAEAIGLIKAAAPGVKLVPYPADLSAMDVDALIGGIEKALGGTIDILVNNTGGPDYGGVAGVTAETWMTYFQSMVLSVMGITNRVLPGMRASKWGRIMTVASSGIVQPIPVLGISNTLRASLASWSKTLSNEVARDGITVNMLIPGRIGTERVTKTDASVADKEGISVEEAAKRSHAQIPAGRYGTIEEFGAVAAFVASQPASYVTGSMIRIDGGAIRAV